MYLPRSEYDRGVNTFSPEGRLFQVEYAMEAIKLGTTVIGLKTAQGIVLAAEKRISSSLLLPSSIEKIIEVDSHVGMALSGVAADSRLIMDHARLEATNHTFVYEEPIPMESIAQSVGDLALRFGEGIDGQKAIMSRPFGVSILIAGIDSKNGPILYHTDPSGTYLEFDAKAIGAGSEAAMITLESSYKKVRKLPFIITVIVGYFIG
ncbi:alpha type subunit of proteasome [Mitosporidium daphniae]|uniref:Proteasome subunit alpha type n=1 Tax=Mitosporidium daphniae TaxID=1485682 RepID=A0A098VSC3_9MICR|nr:alpha type subunit of proteasome [Mitosporidium daphniae]KGG51968.1 alpha type subunit of proteasome [Mitosporidium daphniae]|eukprot:XP_013238404.1 alpha type subunit of proteasome [Mitosporidium daphniae]